MHPMIIGELACGHLQNRRELLALWQNLPTPVEAIDQEAMLLLEARNLMGESIGYVDLPVGVLSPVCGCATLDSGQASCARCGFTRH